MYKYVTDSMEYLYSYERREINIYRICTIFRSKLEEEFSLLFASCLNKKWQILWSYLEKMKMSWHCEKIESAYLPVLAGVIKSSIDLPGDSHFLQNYFYCLNRAKEKNVALENAVTRGWFLGKRIF